MPTKRDPYFAIADVTRRAILHVLWDEGQMPAGRVAGRFHGIGRVAVSKHLRILREAGLVTVEPRGREAWYALDKARLAELHETFFGRFAATFETSLEALKRVAVDTPERDSVRQGSAE